MAQNKTKANVLRGERAESILDRDGATSTQPFFWRRDPIQGGRASLRGCRAWAKSPHMGEPPHENGSSTAASTCCAAASAG